MEIIKKISAFCTKNKLLLFFLFVLLFRFSYASQVINFTQDQARDVWLMNEFKEEGKIFIGYGPKTSVGNFYLAPFYYQLAYFASLFTDNHPLTMHYFLTFLEAITPVVLFLVLKRITKEKYAYLVSLLYAFSPLVTIFGTFAWNPTIIPLLTISSIYFALHHLESNKKWPIIFFSLFLILTVNLHYQSIVLFPFYLFILFLSLRKEGKNSKWWLIGVAISLLTLAPYFFAEINSDWQNTRNIFTYYTTEHSRYFDRVSKPAFVFTFIPSFIERVLIGENYVVDKFLIGRIVFFLGLGLLFLKSLKNKTARVLLLYIFTVLIMLRVYKGDKLDYYLSTLFFLSSFLLAAILDKYKQYALPFIIVLAFLIGQYFQKIEPKNQLDDINKAVLFLDENTANSNIRFHFHDDNYINVFAYGLYRYSDIIPDRDSKVIADICYGKRQVCEWDGGKWCKHDRGFTYMALFRSDTEYTGLFQNHRSDGYTIVVGEVNQLPEIQYQVSTYSSEYGNDFIKGDW